MLESALKGIDVVMINRGVSGELAANAATRMKNEVALEQPDLVLWQVGTNDALAYVGADEFAQIVKDQIDWLKTPQGRRGAGRPAICAADAARCPLRRSARPLAQAGGRGKRDRHPLLRGDADHQPGSGVASAPVADEFERNEAGYNCLAQYVARAITLGVFAKNMPKRPPPKPPK